MSFCALLLYAVAATPLAPALTALAAALDPAHHAMVAMSTDGPCVVLHHDCAPSPAHHHGPMAKVLIFLAQPGNSSQPDHVIQFRASSACERSVSTAVKTFGTVKETSLVSALAVVIFSAVPSSFSFKAAPPAPPEASARLRSVHTTVLLI